MQLHRDHSVLHRHLTSGFHPPLPGPDDLIDFAEAAIALCARGRIDDPVIVDAVTISSDGRDMSAGELVIALHLMDFVVAVMYGQHDATILAGPVGEMRYD